jgi:hypothetical protein
VSRSIIIAGVGRSGTKLLQLVVSYIVADQFGPMSVHYEPLLWCDYRMKKTNPEGIAVHKSLPLLADAEIELDERQRAFFSAFREERGYARVTKFIRMTGRLPLLRKLFPKSPILFVHRDPVGVVNSLLNMPFSLLGPPHYESDLPRLMQEMDRRGWIDREAVAKNKDERWFAETIHWQAMNRKALEDIGALNAHAVGFEPLVNEREATLREVCGYIGAEYRSDYLKLFDIPGSNIRLLDQLLVKNEYHSRRGRPGLGDRVRSWAAGVPAEAMFSGARPLDAAGDLREARHEPERKERLSEAEARAVREFCADVLRDLKNLSSKAAV